MNKKIKNKIMNILTIIGIILAFIILGMLLYKLL